MFPVVFTFKTGDEVGKKSEAELDSLGEDDVVEDISWTRNYEKDHGLIIINKPGTAQVGAKSKAQK